ncbi:MAG: hypothetical protein IKR25_01630 [Muribaculaceae bacterium]|nr:hypothetical protein [Muribaculaceae bacterium]
MSNVNMRASSVYFLTIICTLVLLASCQHDEPDDFVKPLAERTVLLLKENGEIYNFEGELIKKLPDCHAVTQIIVEGEDYFVSGVSTKDRVGYWKNGKWNTLHVDFIDDVDHWAFGIGKWDYYIFLLDYPNVLKNSGIYRLNECENFAPAHHGISVSEGKCYVVGSEVSKTADGVVHHPICYTEHKGGYEKEKLPFPHGAVTGEALAVRAYDKDHFIIGGYAGREPIIWIDRQPHVMPRTFDCIGEDGQTFPFGIIESIVRCNGHIYCGGFEYIDEYAEKSVPTLWCDDVPKHLVIGYDKENYYSGKVVEMVTYGDDVYTLTLEMYDNDNELPSFYSMLWLNGELLKVYEDFLPISLAVF